MSRYATFLHIIETWRGMYDEAERNLPGRLLVNAALIDRLAEPNDEQGTIVFEGVNSERTRRQLVAEKARRKVE